MEINRGSIVRKIKKYLQNPRETIFTIGIKTGYPFLDDEKFIQLMWSSRFRSKIDLKNPKTFNEKMQWLKLHDRNPIYTDFADKYAAKERVKSILGKDYVIPTYGVWNSADEIDFSNLPNRFVLKCTHDSGGVLICTDKNQFDFDTAKRKLNALLHKNYYWSCREWPYKNINPKIIAEEYLQKSERVSPDDYKIFVFSGKAYCIQVDYDRFTDHHRNFYSLDWEYMPFTTLYPTNPNKTIPRPSCLEELVSSSEKLAKALEDPMFLRTDFYILGDRIYFGEVTFYHGGGTEPFYPSEYDYILGEKIIIGGSDEK